MTAAETRVLIVDDHPLFRDALRHVVLAACPGASFVEAASYAEMLGLTREDERFDLIFVDLLMPGGEDLDALIELRQRVPLTPTVVVSSRDDGPTIRRVMGCGVSGYIPKSASRHEMERAIRRVLEGDIYVPEVTPEAAARGALAAGPFEPLTPRQLAVLEQLSRGSSNRQIAHDLGIEEITVKAHISAILRKFHVKNRVQAVVVSRAYLERIAQA